MTREDAIVNILFRAEVIGDAMNPYRGRVLGQAEQADAALWFRSKLNTSWELDNAVSREMEPGRVYEMPGTSPGDVVTTSLGLSFWMRPGALVLRDRDVTASMFGSGSRAAPAVRCDLCGLSMRPGGVMAVHVVKDQQVLMCECLSGGEREQPYVRPWWLRLLRWLAKL